MGFKRESKTRIPRKGIPRRVFGINNRVFNNFVHYLELSPPPVSWGIAILDPVAHLVFLILAEVSWGTDRCHDITPSLWAAA